ncbi:MAG: NADH-quinone oxidoreductase subunit N [Anaerolineae bacterium]|nr:NADH-quinone oxidoreductase subunit N [Anaerolineae bacterium]
MNNLVLLLPEIIITVIAFAILTLDVIWQGGRRSAVILPWVAFAGTIGALLAAVFLWPFANEFYPVAISTGDSIPMLALDPMAIFFKILATLTVALVGLSAVDYLNTHTPFRGEFYALTLLAGLSLMLLSSATNLILIYLSLEFLSISSYILTGYLRHDARSTEAAMKYFLYGALASGVMLYGFSLLFGFTGNVDLAAIARSLIASPPNLGLVLMSLLLILVGFGFKIALVPFHQWSPDAYEGAPTPITAFLSVGPKVAGFAVLIRVMVVALPAYQVNWTAILSLIAILTMTLGNLVALWQKNMKRMLAYSSIAQAGYMLIGLAAWSSRNPEHWLRGDAAIMLFLFAYLFTNLGLFAVAIAVENKTGSAEIADYAGLIRRSPFLAVALLIFLLSLVGIPPTGGFMGKLFVFGAAINQQLYALAVIGIINSVISVYYYFGVARLALFGQGEDESPIRPGLVMNAVVGVTMVMTLVIALYGQPFINLANNSAQILAAAF